jgi:peptide-N4-(N-acetyl-beta-glucosaminyl)asparagine amidase
MLDKEMTEATEEELKYGAKRIEYYKCKDCDVYSRFPRYNDPIKLYETRIGRCGEWANAFTALCVALGHTSRRILDWTDHVWTEVWIDSYQRWVHMDCCENIFDAPITYEQGWGKKLTYLIAF